MKNKIRVGKKEIGISKEKNGNLYVPTSHSCILLYLQSAPSPKPNLDTRTMPGPDPGSGLGSGPGSVPGSERLAGGV
jgi:hypothetical protein